MGRPCSSLSLSGERQIHEGLAARVVGTFETHGMQIGRRSALRRYVASTRLCWNDDRTLAIAHVYV